MISLIIITTSLHGFFFFGYTADRIDKPSLQSSPSDARTFRSYTRSVDIFSYQIFRVLIPHVAKHVQNTEVFYKSFIVSGILGLR
jgi:hypothetical protein